MHTVTRLNKLRELLLQNGAAILLQNGQILPQIQTKV